MTPINATALLSDIEQWGRDRNIIGGSTGLLQLPKLIEEMGEMAGALARNNREKVIDGVGDIIVVLTMIAGNEGFSIEQALLAAYNDIKDRKGVLYNGVFVRSNDPRYEEICMLIAAERNEGPYAGT